MGYKGPKATNIYQNPGIKNNPGVITDPSIKDVGSPTKNTWSEGSFDPYGDTDPFDTSDGQRSAQTFIKSHPEYIPRTQEQIDAKKELYKGLSHKKTPKKKKK